MRLDATYLLPIRLSEPADAELTAYLKSVSRHCRLIVVDGSPDHVFRASHRSWSAFARHVPPAEHRRCANGKVHGVLTGLDLVGTPLLIIADDDVRYTHEGLDQCLHALGDADLVRPQNYFEPLPWHARWDTARIILNRATGGDFPGTLLVRTAALRDAGGYSGDVLFENLEMMRSLERSGAICVSRPDLFVRRLPPTARHFRSQRVRQAYDEFARPHRLLAALSLLPAATWVLTTGRSRVLLVGCVTSIALAEVGRRRGGGRAWFPGSASFLAPLWLLERAVCAWCAVWCRLTGGVRYGSGKLAYAATPRWPRPRPFGHHARRLSSAAHTPDGSSVSGRGSSPACLMKMKQQSRAFRWTLRTAARSSSSSRTSAPTTRSVEGSSRTPTTRRLLRKLPTSRNSSNAMPQSNRRRVAGRSV